MKQASPKSIRAKSRHIAVLHALTDEHKSYPLHDFIGRQASKVNATGNFPSVGIPAVPNRNVKPSIHPFPDKGAHEPTPEIIHR